ncbi:hypothetical protein ACYE2N_10090 [Flavobacterium sp. MAHUQ-51]
MYFEKVKLGLINVDVKGTHWSINSLDFKTGLAVAVPVKESQRAITM